MLMFTIFVDKFTPIFVLPPLGEIWQPESSITQDKWDEGREEHCRSTDSGLEALGSVSRENFVLKEKGGKELVLL